MADEKVPDELELKPAEAGAMFKAEMFATNLVLGYWRHGVALVVLVLLGILAWGQYGDWYRNTQRATAAHIADVMSGLPAPMVEIPSRLASGEAVDLAAVEKVADDLVAVANGAGGTARTEALMTAAELYRIVEKPEKQRTALEKAEGAPGVLGWSVGAALANLELEQGQGDSAVARLRKLSEAADGYLGEQALIDLGLALEHLDRRDEAAQVYADFLSRFPESKRADQVKARQARVSAPAVEPAEGGGAG